MINKNKLVVFSGIQPSGDITIGNYIGVLNNIIDIQNKDDKKNCIICIADLHSITSCKKINIKDNIFKTLSLLIASGINPDKTLIFLQSKVIEHLELFWILLCYSNFNKLSKMNKFKKLYKNESKNIKLGILNYPVLMSSDILLYNSNIVLVGKDQKQHLEFCKYISIKFNNEFGNVFLIPEVYIKNYSYIMSLNDCNNKMSKSDINKNNFISLLDNNNILFNKIKNSITDSEIPPKIYFNEIKKPGISNLIKIFSNISNTSIKEVENYMINKSYNFLKNELYINLSKKLGEIQEKYYFIFNEKKYLENLIVKNSLIAKNIAKKNINKIKSYINFF
ncbi:tryptophan--tRNA ligase [endosymbiont of Sipalinus gigas]|uniref:tryptophan--tRNA ligase n=1 Tax=endosymbiont of Sipalinus gigas TaxID=1972134 RepID=UPI000DC70B13|nr:tryptophan--tRNA ligase [endosymbiont of Sipalinus gigas]BBA85328.1 tryptophan--tRNA ligase [endosymbiont of Sipalinus gigas]